VSVTPLGARVRVMTAAVLFSTGGAAIKAVSLDGWQVSCARSGIAALAVLLMVPEARRAMTWRSGFVGVAYAATLTLFVVANKLTTSANTIFLQSTAPLYLVLLGPWLLRDRVKRSDLVFMAALAVGMSLFFVGAQRTFATAPRPLAGNVLAALSGLSWAFTVIGLRWLGRFEEGRPGSGAAAVVAGNLIATAACLLPATPWPRPSLQDVVLLLFLGVVQIGVSYVLLTVALRHVGALEASLLLLVEPMLNPFWAWWVHGELPGPWSMAGCAIILVATTVKTVAGSRRPDVAAAPA